ncbi:MAG: gamma-glutamyltransferase [bacterium]
MVASTHWLASSTGMSVLERGGNAADAAVAAAFVLHVVEPHLNGPGGEVPILLWDPAAERVQVVAGQGTVPAGATIEHYRDLGLDLVPGTGLLAATVPGAVGAWLLVLRQWGSWSVADVLAPAIAYAERGVPLLPAAAVTVERVADLFRADWPSSAGTWLPDGAVPTRGQRFRRPELAATWTRLVAEAQAAGPDRESQIEAARRSFYEGFVAEAIDAHCRSVVRDSSGEPHAGVLTDADLSGWSCGVEDPVTYDYHGVTVAKTGPWGQGPVLLQQLALLSGFDLDETAFLGVDWIHTVVECAKLAFADREAWYGDPGAVDVPLGELLSADYSAARRRLVGDEASPELRPGSPCGREPRLPVSILASGKQRAGADGDRAGATGPAAGGAGEPTVGRDGTTRGDTCHVDVVDRHGMMISATPSGGWLQSSPTVLGLGFCLGTRAQMAWLEPDLPASLRPGTRPRTTLSPSLLLRDGHPYVAFGTPGGDQQDQWSLLFLLAHLHAGLDLQAAIDAPAFHTTSFPSSFWPRASEPAGLVVESRIDPAVVADLRRRGHDITLSGEWTLGRLSAVGVERETGFLMAAANPRGGSGYAVGR